jgi:glycosyltransferase involved in cell wall biosynthesis
MTVFPKVSVVVPTRRATAAAARAIRSVLEQDYGGEIECIVVVDDDEGPRALPGRDHMPGRSVRLLAARAANAAAARNAGAEAASGELLAFCDDDDEWLPHKLRVQVAALGKSGRAVSTCGINIWHRGRMVSRLPAHELVVFADLVRSRLADMHTSTIVVARDEFLGAIGPFDEDIPASYGEDYEWLLRAARRDAIRTVRRPLVNVYWAGDSYFQGRWGDSIRAHRYLLDKHPQLERDPAGRARIYGQIAFACAASGRTRDSWSWTQRCLASDWRQPRGYLALAASVRLLPPDLLLRALRLAGRGV